MIRLADFVMKYLESIGVKDVFVVSGGGAIFLCDALAQTKEIRYYCCHHEQAVSFATEGYARCRNDLGVSVVTTGPGGTNTITGVTCAWIDSTPHLTISGQVFLNQTIRQSGVRQLGVQEINIIDLVRPVTKYAVMIEDPQSILYHLQKAIFLAQSGRPGPVWIDVPADIQNAKINPADLPEFNPEEIQIAYDPNLKEKVAKVVKLLRSSHRPLLHAGFGVKIAHASELFLQFVEKHRIPFVTTWNATDLINSDHELFVGRPGTFAQRGVNFAVQNADCYVAVGSRLSLPVTGYNSKDYARKAQRVMVDIDKTELEKDSLDMHIKIHADAREFLEELDRQWQESTDSYGTWILQCQDWKKKYPVVLPEYKKQQGSVNSYYFIDLLSNALGPQAVVITDMGLSFVGTHMAFRIKKGQRLFTNSGHAPMGWGLPAAIGACIANDKKTTICLSGEGGLLMNIQELATVMHHNLPIKLFIYNNGGYLTIKQTQQLGFDGRLMGSTEDSGISFPDFKYMTQAHHLPFLRINNHQQLEQELQTFLDAPGPGVCELIMDCEQPQVPKAINRKRPDGTTEPTPLEDMYPFLDREELQANMLDDSF